MASLSASMLLLLITWFGFYFVACGNSFKKKIVFFIYVYKYNAVKCSHEL